MKTAVKTTKRLQRKKRVRSTIIGTAQKPRLSVFRSNKAIYAQLIDDTAGKTLASGSSLKAGKSGITAAAEVGKAIGQAAKAAKIDTCVFDRNGYKYHGRVKALAEAAREAGLQF